MPAPAPALNYLSSAPVPAVEVYFNDLQLKNLYTSNTVPTNGTGWIVNYGTGGAGTVSFSVSGGPAASGNPASSGYGRISISGVPSSGYVGAYRSSPALGAAGATYTHSIWVRASISCPIRPSVESFNGGTYVGSYIAPTVNLVANQWTRISVTAPCLSGADRTRIVAYCPVAGYWDDILATLNFDFSSVLCEQTSDLHDYYTGTSGAVRTNLISNPSFETNTTGWQAFNSSIARVTTQAWTGNASLAVTSTTGNNTGVYNTSNRIAVTVGSDYTLSGYVKDGTMGLPWRATVLFYDAATGGNIVQSYNGTSTTVSNSSWTRVSVTGNVPATATHAQVYLQSVGTPTAGLVAYVDGVLFEQKTGTSVYYEGSTGTNAMPDTITVYRLCDGETNIIRSAKAAAASTAFTVNDFEVPFGKPVYYYAETFSSGTSLGYGEKGTTTVNSTEVWVHDPLDLSNGIGIDLSGDNDATLGQGSFGTITKAYDYNRSMVIGKSKPILQFYGEKAIQGLQFEVIAKAAGSSKLRDLLSTGPVLIRVPGQLDNLPRLMYGVIEASQQPIDWHVSSQATPLTRWVFTFNETEAQSLDIVVTFYSYAYWQAKYATYDAAAAVYAASTYINAVRNPPA